MTPPWKPSLILAVTLLLTGLVCYAPTLGGEFLTWDDILLVSNNKNLQYTNLQTIKTDFTSYDPELYIPLTFTSYRLDMLLGGSSTIFHVHSVILHAINALLVAWLVWLLVGTGWPAVACGFLFLLHPLNVEAASWIAARKDVLSTMFFLGSLIAYVSWARAGKKMIYALSLVLFLLGLLSKVMVITLPAVLLLIDWFEGRRITVKSLMAKLPFFALSVIFGIVAVFGKSEVLVQSTALQKVLMAFKSTWFYLTSFVWPYPLSVMYPYTKPITLGSPDFWFPLACVLTLIAVVAIALRKHTYVVFGGLFFLITLIPTFLSFTKAGDIYFASDRYAYIPMVGLLVIVACLITRYLEQAEYRQKTQRLTLTSIGCVVVAGAYFVLSTMQSSVWASNRALYEHALQFYPDSQAAHTNLGMESLQFGSLDDAQAEFLAALKIRDNPYTRVDLASVYVRKAMPADAMREYRSVIAKKYEIPDAHYGLADVLQSQRALAEAEKEYLITIQLDPKHAMAYNNLGTLMLLQERWKDAAKYLEKAAEINPEFPEALLNLGIAYTQDGDKASAIEVYEKALVFAPKDSQSLAELAWLHYETGNIPAAAQRLRESLQIDGGHDRSLALVERMKKDGVAR